MSRWGNRGDAEIWSGSRRLILEALTNCQAEDATEQQMRQLGALLEEPRPRFQCLHFGSTASATATATFPGVHPLPRGENVHLRGNNAQLGTFTGFCWMRDAVDLALSGVVCGRCDMRTHLTPPRILCRTADAAYTQREDSPLSLCKRSQFYFPLPPLTVCQIIVFRFCCLLLFWDEL